MAVNLLELYSEDMPQEGVDLIEKYGKEQSFSPLDIARQRIKKLYPQAPDTLIDALLKITPSKKSPTLEKFGDLAGIVQRGTEKTGLPALSRGLFQSLAAPIQFGAEATQFGRELTGNKPSDFLEKLSKPLPKAPTPSLNIPGTSIDVPLAQTAELVGEGVGAITAGSPLFKALKTGTEAIRLPSIIGTPIASTLTGSALSPENPLVGGAVGLAAPALAKTGKLLFKDLPTLTKKQMPIEAFNKALQRHDILSDSANKLYNVSEKLIKSRNLTPFRVEKDIIDLAEQNLPKTESVKKLLSKARKGDPQALIDLQSDMRKDIESTFASKNSTKAERNAALELRSARDRLNESFQSQLLEQGHADIASIRKQANNLYAKKMQTYYNKNLKPTVRNIFKEGKRLRPGQTDMDLIKPFLERSDAMDAFLAEHPELKQEIELIRTKQQIKENLSPLTQTAKATGIGGGLLKATDLLKNLF